MLIVYLWAANSAVHFQVAAHEYKEGDPVNEHEKDDIGEGGGPRGRLERQTDGELAIVGDADQRQHRHHECEDPPAEHNVTGVFKREPLVQVHRVRDGVITFEGNHG